MVFAIVFFTLSVSIFPYNKPSAIVYGVIVNISLVILLYMYKTKKYVLVYWIYGLSATCLTQYSLNFILDAPHYADFIWIISTIVFTYVGIGKRAGWLFIIFNCVGLGYYVSYSFNLHLEMVDKHSVSQKMALVIELIFGFITLGYVLNQYLTFQVYSRNQLKTLNFNLAQQNRAIKAQNEENITLLKEVHHRVKNNLQIIISLLRMQKTEIDSEEAKEHFNIAINRILTMSMIHQKLYREKEPSRINIKEYIHELSEELLSVSNTSKKVNFELYTTDEYAGLKTIVPFGLLINELISNSLKHAFADDREREIKLHIVAKNNEEIIVIYEDNGDWIEPRKEVNGFGLELIDILTEQLDGSYEREGSKYTFTISRKID